MTITSLLTTLWRQRLFVLPAAIVGGLLCVLVVVSSPPVYRASGSIVLLSPPSPPQVQMGGPSVPDEWQNPYTRIGDLSVIVDILVRVTSSEPVMNDLAGHGFVGVPEIAANRDYYRGPIIDVAAQAPTAEAAIADVGILMDELNQQLAQLQERQGTSPEYSISSEVVIPAERATTVFSGTLRKLILVLAFSAVLIVGTGILADRARARRRNAKATARSAPPSEGTDEQTPPVHAHGPVTSSLPHAPELASVPAEARSSASTSVKRRVADPADPTPAREQTGSRATGGRAGNMSRPSASGDNGSTSGELVPLGVHPRGRDRSAKARTPAPSSSA